MLRNPCDLLLLACGALLLGGCGSGGGGGSAGSSGPPPRIYRVGTLSGPPGMSPSGSPSFGCGLNNQGTVVATAYSEAQHTYHAAVYFGGQGVDLGTLGGTYSYPADINDAGQVVGKADTVPNTVSNRAFLWSDANGNGANDPGEMKDLGLGFSEALGINAGGQIIGVAGPTPFLWSGGAQVTLVSPPGDQPARPGGINAQGQVVGASASAAGDFHPLLWSDGQVTRLPTPGDNEGGANDINDQGQIVGYFRTGNSPHAALWQNGQVSDLGKVGGIGSEAYRINNRGQIIGISYTGNDDQVAFLYENGRMYDLNRLIPPGSAGRLSDARAINDQGQILVSGPEGVYLLTPQ